MTKTAEQIAREQAIAKQNANTQQGLMQLKQKEALKSDNFLAPENKTEGGLEGPTLSREFGTSVGGSAYLMPTDYGTEPEMDRIWEQPVTLPDIDEPEDIDLELIKPLEELEQVPYLTEEYYNAVQDVNDLSVAARSAGFNIKKPDASDPRQMKAYTLYQQTLGSAQELGAKLQEGYKAQQLVATNPEKYAKLLYNKEAGITRATQYSDLVGSDIDKGVVEFNKGLEAWEKTTDKDNESYKIKEQEYNTMYNDLAVRLNALTKAGRLDEAMRVKVSMDALRKPVQTFNMEEYDAQTRRMAANKQNLKNDITKTEKIIKTDIFSKVAAVTSNPTIYTESNGVLSTKMLNGYKYNGKNITKIEIGDPSHTKGLWNLTPEDARHYYTLKQKQRNLTALLKLSPEQMVKYRQDEEGFKKYVQDFNRRNDTDLPNDYDELFDENGKLLANTLTEKELASIKRFEEDRGYGLTIYTEGDVNEETGEKSENSYYLEPNDTNSLLDNIIQNSDIISEDQKAQFLSKYSLVDQNNKLDGDLIDNTPVYVDFDFNGDGKTEKVAMGNQEQRALMKANYLLRQGEYSMVEDAFVSFLDDDSDPDRFTAPAARFENSVIGGAWTEYFVNNGDSKAFRFDTTENPLFGTVRGIEIVPDVGMLSNPWGERRFKIHVVNSDGNDYLPPNIWNKLNIEGKERDDAFTIQEMQEFIKNSKVIANDPKIKKYFQKQEENIAIFRKKRSKIARTELSIKDEKVTRKFYGNPGDETDMNYNTGDKTVIGKEKKKVTDW